MKIIRVAFACTCLLLLCSCATTPEPSAIIPASELPADVAMNKEAGRGFDLVVTLRLESGEELSFVVDTGASYTCFDKSLEPKLGKRLGTDTSPNFGNKLESGIYAAPRLYLENTPLMTGNKIHTLELRKIFKVTPSRLGYPIMGVLGIDCLRHYCIQLDFEAGKIRFLGPDDLNAATLGKAFPITFSSEGQNDKEDALPFIYHGSLIGGKGSRLLIDTGYNLDGGMEPRLFRREVQEQSGVSMVGENVLFPKCAWDGETYTNLTIGTWPNHVHSPNLIGLSFLARHLVTLNFPKQTMYLKRTSVGPLVDVDEKSAWKFLHDLIEKGQMPGWSKGFKGAIYFEPHPNSDSLSATFNSAKNGHPSIYHYKVTRTSKDSPWKLQRAWQTDTNEHLVKEYPVP